MADAPVAQLQHKPPKKGKLVSLLVIGTLMAGEGVGVFFLANALGPDPAPSLGLEGDLGFEDGSRAEDYAELEIAECRPSNRMAGRFINFHIRVSALVSSEDLDRAEKAVRSKRARLEDGVNTVIRSANPKQFHEPDYLTIKRRLKREFDRILHDDQLIKEVVIPHLLQSGPGV